MWIKYIVLLALVIAVGSLVSALFSMVRRKGGGEDMARALTIRIGISLALVIFLIVAAALGWITPHGLMPVPVPVQ